MHYSKVDFGDLEPPTLKATALQETNRTYSQYLSKLITVQKPDKQIH